MSMRLKWFCKSQLYLATLHVANFFFFGSIWQTLECYSQQVLYSDLKYIKNSRAVTVTFESFLVKLLPGILQPWYKKKKKKKSCWLHRYLGLSILCISAKSLDTIATWEYWSASSLFGSLIASMLEVIWILCFWNFDNWLNYGWYKVMCIIDRLIYLLHLVSFNCSVLYKDKFTQQ